MADLGVRFEFSRAVTGIRIPGLDKTRLQPGAAIRAYYEGIGLPQTLFDLAAGHGIDVLYDRQINRILVDDAGRVIGVRRAAPAVFECITAARSSSQVAAFRPIRRCARPISAGPGFGQDTGLRVQHAAAR